MRGDELVVLVPSRILILEINIELDPFRLDGDVLGNEYGNELLSL